jgi:L-iditol 2-dehydrogenase
MRASVLIGIGRFELRDLPDPPLGPRDVLVAPAAVGVCGTDFHIASGESNFHLDERGEAVPLERAPQVLGHEIVARVQAVGSAVRDLAPGERVVVDQGLSCTSRGRAPPCEYCASGDSHQCAEYAEHGITGLPGGFAELLAVPAVNAVRIESELAAVEAALAEPLACVLHSSERAARAEARYALGAAEPERRVRAVLVLGAGPAGLLFVQVLRHVLGFDGVLLVSEPNAAKRALAERFGAETLDPGRVDLAEAVLERTDGRRVEYLIEASGAGRVFAHVPGLIRKQATLLLYGIGHGSAGLALLNPVQWKEPTLVASVGASGGFDADGRPAVYRRALRLLEARTVDAAALVTHRYSGLASVPAAFGGDQRQPGYVKGVVLLP